MSKELIYSSYTCEGNRIFTIYDGKLEIAQVPVNKYNPMRSEDFARLFSAAPDLLAALYSAERVVEDFCTGQAPKNQNWDVLAEINAAIAKATGETK